MNRKLPSTAAWFFALLLFWLGPACILGAAHAQQPQPTGLGREFSSQYLRFDGVLTHFVRGGTGPAIVLLHGFPQDWSEWRNIMPQLARRFTVVAVDLPGIGGSAATPDRYDAAAMARTMCNLVVALNLHGAYLVGHDIGGMVAYAFVRDCPQVLRGAMILDAPLPGIPGWDEVQSDPLLWHVKFMQTPGLPEKLIVGRQAEFFDYFFAFSKFSKAEKAHYAQAYGSLSQLHAVFEMYRAFPVTEKFNAAQRDTNDVPTFIAFGQKSPFVRLMPKIADGLRANGMKRVETGTIPNAVHYLVQDNPQAVAELIEQQATRNLR